VEAALRAAAERPELRMLAAEEQQAEAAIRNALTYTRPEYGIAARYAREEGDHIFVGGLRITLPLFATAQEPRDVASAQAARLRTELAMERTRIQSEVRSAHAAYSRRLNAVRVLERDALPTLDENTQLNARSFEVGQIGLPDMLLVQREILEARLHYLEALLEAALARVELDARAGVLR
jgi:cobalt-zinc-cadmium efflux system outer membrane protein